MIELTRCPFCTSDNYLEDGAHLLHQQIMHPAHPSGGTASRPAPPTLVPMTQRPKLILCAHADLDGRGAHWRPADEPCWVAQAVDDND